MKPSSMFLPVFFIAMLASPSPLAARQTTPTAGATPAPRIQVDAPYAEQLIQKIKSQHPEIQKLSLHAVPPGQTVNAIIASNYPQKVGKLSSPSDLQMVASGKPKVNRIQTGGFWDTFIPLHNRNGKTIGFLVMEVPFATASTEEGAIAEGIKIRTQVERQAPTLAKLFGPAK
ncbi:MAG TPA: hypothetical protein VME86_11640 [Acidobacteriaceae bacterium]|nr:hypothetical protein [Acidobacteriaceae bacterium]